MNIIGGKPAGPEVRLEAYMASAGCRRQTGHAKNGDIGVFTSDSVPEMYTCKGRTGSQIRGAIEAFRGASAAGITLANNETGYFLRHYLGSEEWCVQTTYLTYYGTQLVDIQKVFDGPCEWRYYFWDEWIPYGSGDEIPSGGGGSATGVPGGPQGGGPFFSPEDEEHREPTIDTMPDTQDHLCDSFYFDTSSSGAIRKHLNFKCLTKLSDTLKAIIWDSLDQYLRPLANISDTLARRECDSIRVWFDEVREWDDTNTIGFTLIWQGRTDSLTSGNPHDAQSYSLGTKTAPVPFHVDPKIYNKAGSTIGKKETLRAVLHEILHAWANQDHDDPPHYANYPYFRSLMSGQCIL